MINPWKVLRVHRKSSYEQIRDAFYKLAKKHHPDKGGEDFFLINEAYQLIKNKAVAQKFIDKKLFKYKRCTACREEGCTFKQKGWSERVYTICPQCFGAGILIPEGEDNDTIELQSANQTGKRSGHTKRKS